MARHASRAPVRDPYSSVRIRRHTIWTAVDLFVESFPLSLLRERSIHCIEVEGVDLIVVRVGEEHRLLIERPRRSIRDRDAIEYSFTPMHLIEAVKSACRCAACEVHRASPETAAAVALAIVESVALPIGLWVREPRDRARVGLKDC